MTRLNTGFLTLAVTIRGKLVLYLGLRPLVLGMLVWAWVCVRLRGWVFVGS